jgi:hypothetical protein
MTRVLSVCAVLLALPLFCQADNQPGPTETVIHLKVTAAPAPKPALRYQLLPELREMNPGNAIQAYMRCFMEQNNFWYNQEAVDNRSKWWDMPLRDLPLAQMRVAGYGKGARPLVDADFAARLDRADWQVLVKLRTEGIDLLVPEVQSMRLLVESLALRFRVEVAERRFDDAFVTAKTMFALARHMGEHPTLIGHLVGVAIATITIERLEEMLQQPGCPNLYWALTNLPDPLVDLRAGLQGERILLAKLLEALDEREPMTDVQLRKVVGRIRALLKGYGIPAWQKKDVSQWLSTRTGNLAHVSAARKRLVEFGLSDDRVKQFPPLQVVVVDEKLAYEVVRDEETKVMMLPYWQGQKTFALSWPKKAGAEEGLFTAFASGPAKVRPAHARLQQRIGLLRCFEALRMYAAEHEGGLPMRLEDIKLPLPVDPFTGRSLAYRLADGKASVRGTPPAGMERIAVYNVRYEVTIVK